MTILYGITFAVAVLMTGVCIHVDRKRDAWLLFLFISIAVCNLGYFLMSLATQLDFALFANRIAYLGNVFLPFFMLMMIINLSGFRYPAYMPWVLVAINCLMLFITISGGFLPIYYKEVSFEIIDGMPTLIKEYGPLHIFYKFYLFGYFAAMVGIIIRSTIKKTFISNKHAAFLAFLVIGNITIWIVENIIDSKFEFVSVSYLVTEGLILFIYDILQDYGLLDSSLIESATEKADRNSAAEHSEIIKEETIRFFTKEQIDAIFKNWDEVNKLTQREAEVLKYIFANEKRQIIAQELFVTESTIKKHTANIFRKLGITNRAELFEKAKQFCI